MAPKSVSVTLKYSKPGAQPPVFLAGSFSDPPWLPQEMQYTTDEYNDHIYHKDIQVDEGKEYQYKFRMGLGDWWVLNEDSPTVTDDAGNRNNLLSIPKTTDTPKFIEQDQEALDIPPVEIPHEPTSTPAADMAKTPIIAVPKLDTEKLVPEGEEGGKASSPAVVVEKTGTEPRHGDDFGEKATVAQKDAFHRRSKDAEPDHIVVQDSNPPEVAAEVADSAALLDQDPSTPPISDEEAGRIGFRRMSQTPIPEVAKTAAEVADVAAIIDKESVPALEPPVAFPDLEEDDEHHASSCSSCKSTPPNEKVPKFSHECIGLRPPLEEVPCTHEHIDPVPKPRIPGYLEADEAIDLSNPSIEVFPTTRQEIIDRLRRLSEHLPEEVTDVDADVAPASPIIDPNHPEEFRHMPDEPITPVSAASDHTPPLHIIQEEHDQEEHPSRFLPVTSSTVLNVDLPSTWSVVKDQGKSVDKAEPVSAKAETYLQATTKAEEVLIPKAVEETSDVEAATSKTETKEESSSDDDSEIEETEPSASEKSDEASPSKVKIEEQPSAEKTEHVAPTHAEVDDESSSEDESSADEARPMTSGTAKTEIEESSSDEESSTEEEKQKAVATTKSEVEEESSSEEESVEEAVQPANTRTAIEESSSEEEPAKEVVKPTATRTTIEESSSDEESSVEEEILTPEAKYEIELAKLAASVKQEAEEESSSEVESSTEEEILTPEAKYEIELAKLAASVKQEAEEESSSEVESSIEEEILTPEAKYEIELAKLAASVKQEAKEESSSEVESSIEEEILTPEAKYEIELAKLAASVKQEAEEESSSEEESFVEEETLAVVSKSEVEPPKAVAAAESLEEETSSEEESFVEEETPAMVFKSEVEPPKTVAAAESLEEETGSEEESFVEEETPAVVSKSEVEPPKTVTAAESLEEETSSEEESDSGEAGSVATSAHPESSTDKAEVGEKSIQAKEPEHAIEKVASTASESRPTYASVLSHAKEPEAIIEEPVSKPRAAQTEKSTLSAAKEPEFALEKSLPTREESESKIDSKLVESIAPTSLVAASAALFVDSELKPILSKTPTKETESNEASIVAEKPTTVVVEPATASQAEPIEAKSEAKAYEQVVHAKEPEIPVPEPVTLASEQQHSKEVSEEISHAVEEQEASVIKPTSAISEDQAVHESDSEAKESGPVETPSELLKNEPAQEAVLAGTPEIAAEEHVAEIETHPIEQSFPLAKEAETITAEEPPSVPITEPAHESIAEDKPEHETEEHVGALSEITPIEKSVPEPQEVAETPVAVTEPEQAQEPTVAAAPAATLDEHISTESESSKESVTKPEEAELVSAEPKPAVLEADSTVKTGIAKDLETTLLEHASTSAPTDRSIPEDSSPGISNDVPKFAIQRANTDTPTSDAAKSPGWSELQAKSGTLPNTPFIVSDDEEKSVRKISTGLDSPIITVQSATPAGSISDIGPGNFQKIDTAMSTSVEEPNPVKSRKLQKSNPSPDRPLTPSSMRSSGKDAQDRNFLKAFWRAVFIDWIGGLILKLRGGGRGRNA